MKRDDFSFTHTRTRARTQTSLADTLLRGSHAFFHAIIPWLSEPRPAPFTVYECVFVFMVFFASVKLAALFQHALLKGFSLSTCSLHFGGPLIVAEKPQAPWLHLKNRAAAISSLSVRSRGKSRLMAFYSLNCFMVFNLGP